MERRSVALKRLTSVCLLLVILIGSAIGGPITPSGKRSPRNPRQAYPTHRRSLEREPLSVRLRRPAESLAQAIKLPIAAPISRPSVSAGWGYPTEFRPIVVAGFVDTSAFWDATAVRGPPTDSLLPA